MSKALKCDRCGIYYCDNNYNVKGSKGNTVVGIGLLLRGTGIGVDHFVGMKKMDLCRDAVLCWQDGGYAEVLFFF